MRSSAVFRLKPSQFQWPYGTKEPKFALRLFDQARTDQGQKIKARCCPTASRCGGRCCGCCKRNSCCSTSAEHSCSTPRSDEQRQISPDRCSTPRWGEQRFKSARPPQDRASKEKPAQTVAQDGASKDKPADTFAPPQDGASKDKPAATTVAPPQDRASKDKAADTVAPPQDGASKDKPANTVAPPQDGASKDKAATTVAPPQDGASKDKAADTVTGVLRQNDGASMNANEAATAPLPSSAEIAAASGTTAFRGYRNPPLDTSQGPPGPPPSKNVLADLLPTATTNICGKCGKVLKGGHRGCSKFRLSI